MIALGVMAIFFVFVLVVIFVAFKITMLTRGDIED